MARRRTVEADRIRQAAAELLAASPPEEVTIAAVAAAAGVSAGTVYNYFRNKEHLLAAAAGVPGAVSAWAERQPDQSRQEYLQGLASLALERFRLLGTAGPGAQEALRAEVEWLSERLAHHESGRLVARVFYGAAAAAVLLGWNREDDAEIAALLASLA